MAKRRRFILLCGQVVGSSEYTIEYDWNGQIYSTRAAAIRAGWQERGSDDFNIGVIQGDKLIDLAWMDEGGKADADEISEIETQIGLRQEATDHE